MTRVIRPGRRRTAAAARHFRPWLELLESRRCLALTVPALSSLPGANHTIYLDFDGHTTMGTVWNTAARPVITSPAYSQDADKFNFSAAELTTIQRVWERVAEDFAPFQVNVTTVSPASGDLVKSGSSDARWGVRVVITADTSLNCGCGGIAYIDSFNWNSDTPVFVFNSGETGVAEAVSHEVGHALGLAHDGTASSGYYQGHSGSGLPSWAPIMGVGYYTSVTQWDDGTFYGSTNGAANANYGKGPDDLKIITSYNGFNYRTDAVGDLLETAVDLAVSGTTVSGAGTIERSTDVDVFRFSAGDGNVALTISPAARSPNLDVKAELLDAAGNVIASSSPAGLLSASLTAAVTAGTYYVRVDGVGVGSPTTASPTGYSDYASLGAYSITGTVAAGPTDTLSISATSAAKNEGNSGVTPFTFSIDRTGDLSATTSVTYRVTGTGAAPAAAADFQGSALPTGRVTFLPGETSKVVTVNVVGDTAIESSETFTVTLSQQTGATILGQAAAAGTIVNDDTAPAPPKFNIAATDANRTEGTGTAATNFTFTITRTGDASKSASVWYGVTGVGAAPANFSDFVGGMPSFVYVTFAANQTTSVITLKVAADSTKEANEQFRVTLKLPTGASLGTASADGVILNDDGLGAGGLLGTLLAGFLPPPAVGSAGNGVAVMAVADPLWYFDPSAPDAYAPGMIQEAVESLTWLADDPNAVPLAALQFDFDDDHASHESHEHDHDHSFERSFDEVFQMLHGATTPDLSTVDLQLESLVGQASVDGVRGGA